MLLNIFFFFLHVFRVREVTLNLNDFQEEPEGAENDDADDMPDVQETVSVVPGSTLLWRIDSRPAHSAQVDKHDGKSQPHSGRIGAADLPYTHDAMQEMLLNIAGIVLRI